MRATLRLATLALVVASFGRDVVAGDPPPVAPKPEATKSDGPKDLLVDLAKWDAAKTDVRRAAAESVAKRAPGFELLRMETFACGGQTHEVAVFKHAKTEMEFVLAPGGTFTTGHPGTAGLRDTRRRVTLTQAFLLARTTVTQATWKRVMATDPSEAKGDDLPVESVTWDEAKAFCDKGGLALPTEAQWEHACRAGATTRWPWGDDKDAAKDYAWFRENSESRTHPVALKKSNAFGLFDMSGNVYQWCADWYDDVVSTGDVTDPTGPAAARDRVVRGSNFKLSPASSSLRGDMAPTARYGTTGFRPAKTVGP